MRFDRSDRSAEAGARLLGVGHKIVDRAIAHALQQRACVSTLPSSVLPNPLVVFRVRDRVTQGEGKRVSTIAAVEVGEGSSGDIVLRDWELLTRLNGLPLRRQLMRDASTPGADTAAVAIAIQQAEKTLLTQLDSLDLDVRHPDVECLGALWPSTS